MTPPPRFACRRGVAVVTTLSLALTPMVPVVQAQGAATSAAAQPVPPDGGWPKAYTTRAGAALVIYQPQVSTWDNQKHAVLYAAVSYTTRGATQPAFGTVKIESDTQVATDERLVSFSEFRITESNFPKLPKEQITDLLAEINASVPRQERVIALDRVLASIDSSAIIPKNVEGVKADPPRVFFSKTPAVLVILDGPPIWSPIEGNDLKYAVNTNWDLFEHTPTATFYLRNNDAWLKASHVEGPWTPAGALPASFSKLPADPPNWAEVKKALPGKKIAGNAVPTVFVSQVPAELILLRGEPSYVAVSTASGLLWVSNTDSDLFRMGKTGAVYYLVAGRWFSASDFTGPWTFATPTLPPDFKKIPLEHERSRVLASVPGTPQANEAVLLAQIPQTARVEKTLKAPDVVYQGDPKFEPIPQTSVARAVNTDNDIIKVGDLYYLCFQGVWFMAKSPTGPWTVTGSVPTQIYEIPVSSPSYNVTYVTVQESHDDAVVFATAMAATGVMVAWGCAVWGTGYYYPPYVYHGGFYPVYYPHYPTYGYGASYNPWTGTYGRGAVAYGPYGGAGVGAKYNPRTGTYARGAVAWGPYGARGAAQAYNPRTGGYGATRQGSNIYGSWGTSAVQRGDDWATTSRYTNRATGQTTRTTRTSEGGAAISNTGRQGNTVVARTGSGDVYAGHDGNVYKRDEGGSWQRSDGSGGWSDVQKPTQEQVQGRATQAQGQAQSRAAQSGVDASTYGQLNKDSAARADGAQRTNTAATARSGGTSSGTAGSSYRPSRGGSRPSGGGRRR